MSGKEQEWDVKQGKRMSEWTNERTSTEHPVCICLSNTHICIRFITISHQVADISSFRGNGGVVFGWYVDVYSSCSSSGSVRMMLVNRLIFEYVGWCACVCVCVCVGLLLLSHSLVPFGRSVDSVMPVCRQVIRPNNRRFFDCITFALCINWIALSGCLCAGWHFV